MYRVVLGTLYTWILFELHSNLTRKAWFTDKESETQRGEVICPSLHGQPGGQTSLDALVVKTLLFHCKGQEFQNKGSGGGQ